MAKLTRTTRNIIQAEHDVLNTHHDFLAQASALAHGAVSDGGSPHPTVRVGAVVVGRDGGVIASAANRFAVGVDSSRTERYERGTKSLWINCAEQLAIAGAACRHGDLAGARLYVTLEPCAICAGIIIESGIKEVIVPTGALRSYSLLKKKWKHSIEIGITKLAEAGVKLTAVDIEQPLAVEKRKLP